MGFVKKIWKNRKSEYPNRRLRSLATFFNNVRKYKVSGISGRLSLLVFRSSPSDSLYHICLEMHDEAGNVGHYEKVLEYILPVFVFDRTAELQGDSDALSRIVGVRSHSQRPDLRD